MFALSKKNHQTMKEKSNYTKKSPAHQAIFFMLSLTVLLLESVCILISGLKNGILKKEVLSKKSDLGFDFKIIIK